MTTFADRIETIDARVRDSSMTADTALAELAAGAQHRGGRSGRRADGAYFTDHDVALHLARRSIGAVLLEAAAEQHERVDECLAAGDDLVERVTVAARADDDARVRIVDRLGTLLVLDPTCGAGSFLHAAWTVLVDIDDALDANVVRASQLHGVDVDADAVRACELSLELVTRERGGRACVCVADAETVGSLVAADVVLGNPPYVRAAADERHADLATRRVPNRSAWIVERALAAAAPGARVSFVLPVSTACTDAFQPARDDWDRSCSSVLTSHFDTIPATLFTGVVQRLSIFEGRRRTSTDLRPARWFTSRYHRWLREERAGLLDRVRHVPLPPHAVGGSIAKVGTTVETRLLERLFRHPPAARLFTAPGTGSGRVLYKRRWSYFLLFTDFVPALWDADGVLRKPSELKAIDVADPEVAAVLLAAYSSTLFWWYFSVFTDNRNVNRRDLAAFPLPDLDEDLRARLVALAGELMVELRSCSEVRTCTYRSIGTIRNTYFRQGATRPVIDRIDAALAHAYEMSGEELEFVLAFERRFRS